MFHFMFVHYRPYLKLRLGCRVATFWEIAARSFSNLFSLYFIYLFPVLVLRAGFSF